MAPLHIWWASNESKPREVQMDATTQGECDWQAWAHVLPLQYNQAKSWVLETSEQMRNSEEGSFP